MNTTDQQWYCLRTKPKHEHIASADLVNHLGLEVFSPRLRVERSTCRGVVRVYEPLFPCYIFARCALSEMADEIRYANGVNSLVHFGERIPVVPDQVIDELKQCFDSMDSMSIDYQIAAGTEITIARGSLMGTSAVVVCNLPAKHRVQVLLDFLGSATLAEVDRNLIAVEHRSLADMVPLLAAERRQTLLESRSCAGISARS